MSTRVVSWLKKNKPAFLSRLEQRHPDGRVMYHFWQAGGGYDRNLRTAQEIYEKIQYVHQNPVRRKLVATAMEWPWSSDRAWETGQEGQIPLDLSSLPDVGA
jgi:putative transposase